MNTKNEQKYNAIYENIIASNNIKIESNIDLKKNFPNHYESNSFLETVGRKLYFEGFEKKAKIFLKSIPKERISGHDQYILATIDYCFGDYISAKENFEFALSKGHERSYYWLGYFFENGLIGNVDEPKSLKFYKLGSDCGYLMAAKSYLRLDFKLNSNLFFLSKIAYKLKMFCLILKVAFIAMKDTSDERLADIPRKEMNEVGK